MNKHERGEIATIITIGTLVVIGVTTLVSSFFINQKKTTNSKAAEVCVEKPNIQPPPPAEKEWIADCGKVCSSNANCPFGIGSEEWSRWCYGFSGGNRCMKQVFKSGGGSPPPAASSTPSGGGGGGGGGGTCFQMSGETYADASGGGFKFNTHVKLFSPEGGGDGHIQLWVDGGSKGWNQPWNKGANNPFDIDPQYTDSPTLSNGQSVTKSYRVKIDECGDRGNTAEISCTYSVNGGSPNVTGSCSCASGNCRAAVAAASSAPSTASSRPASTPSGGNTGSTPASSAPAGTPCSRAGYTCIEQINNRQSASWNCNQAGYATNHAESCNSTDSVCCSGKKTGSTDPGAKDNCGNPSIKTKYCTDYIDGAEGRSCPANEKAIADKFMYTSIQNGFFTDSLCTGSNRINDPVDFCCAPPAGANPPADPGNPPPDPGNPPAGTGAATGLLKGKVEFTGDNIDDLNCKINIKKDDKIVEYGNKPCNVWKDHVFVWDKGIVGQTYAIYGEISYPSVHVQSTNVIYCTVPNSQCNLTYVIPPRSPSSVPAEVPPAVPGCAKKTCKEACESIRYTAPVAFADKNIWLTQNAAYDKEGCTSISKSIYDICQCVDTNRDVSFDITNHCGSSISLDWIGYTGQLYYSRIDKIISPAASTQVSYSNVDCTVGAVIYYQIKDPDPNTEGSGWLDRKLVVSMVCNGLTKVDIWTCN